jgi:ATP-dependent helicase/DNAse subunit B
VVAASSRLLRQLEMRTVQSGASLLNVHFHTFASLAENVVQQAGGLEKPLRQDTLFFDTLVKQIIRDERPFELLTDIAVPQGFPSAVRGTLRDLLDAGVNAENVGAAIEEEFAGTELDLGSLRSLLNLHRFYLRRVATLPVSLRAHLIERAIEQAPESDFLASFSEILYYGFYDLTGLQSDFFQAVVKHHPSTLFFPFVKDHPAYAFAARFRDTFLQPVMDEEFVPDAGAVSSPVAARIWNVSGVADEAWLIAAQIRRLHDEENIPFASMAVVARNKERLGPELPRALEASRIPFQGAPKTSLLGFPSVRAFYDRCAALLVGDEKKKWSQWVAVIKEPHPGPLPHGERELNQLIFDNLESLDSFDDLDELVPASEFLDVLRERLTRAEISTFAQSQAGVSLLYAEAARGLAFDAVFVAGMEERVFPRVVREDPFLRDDMRFSLNQTLGHKISQKLTALEEEKLLFELIVASARRELHFIYQRSDADGNVVGASPFLRSYASERGWTWDEVVSSVPRHSASKRKFFPLSMLPERDAVEHFVFQHDLSAASALARALDLPAEELRHGVEWWKLLNSIKTPGAHDGLIGPQPLATLFKRQRGSATALETYGTCPFQYFASRLLDLEPKEEDTVRAAIEADKQGVIIHDFLEKFFRRVTGDGTLPLPERVPDDLFEEFFASSVSSVTTENLGLPELIWKSTQRRIKRELWLFLQKEWVRCLEGERRPALFEKEVRAFLDKPLHELEWGGIMDRLDESPDGDVIVDYKTGRAPKSGNAALDAVRGRKSQGPLYLLLAEKLGRAAASFAYSYVLDEQRIRLLTTEEWRRNKPAIVKTIHDQLELMKSGNFLPMPDDYCSYCDVAQACRKSHSVSVVRAGRGAGKKLWDLRSRALPKEKL